MLVLNTKNGETLANINAQRVAIGRDPANDVVLEDVSVSGFHAVVLNDQGNVSITDLGSTNGTAINGQRIRERSELKAWSTLQLGSVELQVADTESRQPTRVQPAIRVDDARGGQDAAAVTRLRPAASNPTRAMASAPPPGAIRFESLEQNAAASTRIAPASTRVAPASTRVAPASTRVAPASTRVSSAPSVAPTVAQSLPPESNAQTPFALFGGYPRGLVWLLFSFRGRVRRSLFWKSLGIGVVANILTGILIGIPLFSLMAEMRVAEYSLAAWSTLQGLLWMWPSLAIMVKRIHDSGSGASIPCASVVLFQVLNTAAYWMIMNRAAESVLVAMGLLMLVLSFLVFYAFYLIAIKRGDDYDNDYGDQNRSTGAVFR